MADIKGTAAALLTALSGSDFLWACFRLTRALGTAAVFVGTKYLLKLMVQSQTNSEVFHQAFDTVADLTFLGLGWPSPLSGSLTWPSWYSGTPARR